MFGNFPEDQSIWDTRVLILMKSGKILVTKHYNSFGGNRFGRIRKRWVPCWESILRSGIRGPHICGQPQKGNRDLGSGVAGGSTTLRVGDSGNETKLFGSLWKCGGKEIASFSAMYSLTNTG